MFKLKLKTKFIILAIFLVASAFRFYNINWDQGYHLHPDERAIIMTVVKLQYPESINAFLSPDSSWNPKFFAYGSLPFYLLKIAGDVLSFFNPQFSTYDLINIAGRFISALFDLGTVLAVFLLGRKLFGSWAGFAASFFYAVSVLPIQLSHFYAVDTLLTFFCLLTLYRLILFYEKRTNANAVFAGVFLGFAIATKVSAVILLVPVAIVLLSPALKYTSVKHLLKTIRSFILETIFVFTSAFIAYVIFSPYTFIDFKEFWRQTMEQSQMTHNAFIFPYTLQYVGKVPYLYELKNIFFWGLGPVLGTIIFAGTIYFFYLFFSNKNRKLRIEELIVILFFIIYFIIVGRFAIGFMRYMLPIYPLLCLFGGLIAYRCIKNIKKRIVFRSIKYFLSFVFFIMIFIWPLSFIQIYSVPNTRVTATEWINNFIPAGKILAQEHWDDAVPMYGGQNYRFVTLPLYDQDTPAKWQNLNSILAQTDYIVIASNRLYTPLQKLTDCDKLPEGKCYRRTAEYYRKLLNGNLGFQKITEFTDYPVVPFLNIQINDQSADESFTVYDHPKIMIFQRVNPL